MSQQLSEQVIELFAMGWCFVGAWTFIALLSWSLWSAMHNGIQSLRRLHGVPCDRCVFFTGNYHLKCTVHPMNALSERAIDCPDFERRTSIVPNCVSAKYL